MASPPDAMKRAFRRIFGGKKEASARPASDGPTPEETLLSLIERAEGNPLDGAACYEVAVALLRKGQDEEGIRYLDRAIRLDPLNVVRFVKAPELQEVRHRTRVVMFLLRLRREEEQRSYGAYA